MQWNRCMALFLGGFEMVIILKDNPDKNQLAGLKSWLAEQGVSVHTTEGTHHTILGLVGDTSAVDIDLVRAMEIVSDVKRIQEPYKNAVAKAVF